MSIQSDVAKMHIEELLEEKYGLEQCIGSRMWRKEYRFSRPRLWRFDYAVPHLLCANRGSGLFCQETSSINTTFNVLLP